jgi:plasmid stabilization system protein ParE
MSEFVLHPDAVKDLEEIWEYIAADSLDSADRVREELYDATQSLVAVSLRRPRPARPSVPPAAISNCA